MYTAQRQFSNSLQQNMKFSTNTKFRCDIFWHIGNAGASRMCFLQKFIFHTFEFSIIPQKRREISTKTTTKAQDINHKTPNPLTGDDKLNSLRPLTHNRTHNRE